MLIDIATRDVICLSPADTIGNAARVLTEQKISSLVVTDGNGHPVGIVTERNVLHAMQSGSPPDTTLLTVMSSPVITVPVTMPCLEAYQVCLRDGIRHLVIVDDNKLLLGVVSETDFRLHINLAALAGRRQIATVMSRSVFSLPPDAPLRNALNLMQSHRDTCVVVVESELPVGIITERDIVRLYSNQPEKIDIPVSEVMISPALTISRDSTINDAAERMLTAKVRHMVVVDQAGRIAGLLSEHDLTQVLTLGLIDDKLSAQGVFLHALVNTIPDLVWLKDLNGVYLACNPRFEQFFGAKENDIVGKTDFDFVDKEQAEFFRKYDNQAVEKGGPSVNEERITFAGDGHTELIEATKTPMRDGQGKLIGVLGVGHDISRRKLTEDALYFVAQKGWIEHAENFFDALVQYLGKTLDVDYVIVDKLDEDTSIAETVALYAKGSVVPNMRYSLKGTPCENVMGRKFCCYAQGVQKLFPDDTLLVDMGAESYAGIPLWDSEGQPIGLIAVMDSKPVVRKESVIHVLEIVATRAAAELERERSNRYLRTSESEFRTLTENMPDNVIRYDLDCRVRYMNLAMTLSTAPEFRPVIGKSPVEARPLVDEVARYQNKVERVIATGESSEMERQVQHPEGEFRTHHIRFVAEHDGNGKITGALAIGRDITERKLAEENLRITASVFGNSQEAILLTDANNNITDVNPAFTCITGYSREEVLGRNPRLLNSGRQDKTFYAAMWKSLERGKAWRGEIWNRRKSGEVYAELLSISAICDDNGKIIRYVGVFSDISYLKEHEAELSRVANYDALTGVPNRRLLSDRLLQAILRAQRSGNLLAICYIDLDGFKLVNDQHGHEVGDMLLVNITYRLQGALRAGDTLARLGGDEFVVLFNDLAREQECLQVLDRILNIISSPLTISNHEIVVSASIGVTFYPADNEEGDTLLRHADQAMYSAKQAGKNRYHLYSAEHDQRIRSLHESRRGILQGLDNGEFELYYQPKIELVSGKVIGAEALIRWHHPERGLLLPAEFLPFIEDSDLEIHLGNWVMNTAMTQLEAWCKQGLALEISINISAHHLQSPDFVASLESKLQEHPQLLRNKLQIEVLETAALDDIVHSSDTIDACRKLGINFALDDFGTGYSSLAYLRKLSAGTLKIDQTFVRGMLTDEGDRAIVQGIIALAKTFERKTVAEGIEAAELIQVLTEAGCIYGQGYGIAHPMSEQDFLKWNTERK